MQLEETRSVFSKLNEKLQNLSKQIIDASKENQTLKEQLLRQNDFKIGLEEKAYNDSKQLLAAYNLKCKENDILQKKILIKQKQLENVSSKEVLIEKDSEETLRQLNDFKEQIYAKETSIQQLKDKYSLLLNKNKELLGTISLKLSSKKQLEVQKQKTKILLKELQKKDLQLNKNSLEIKTLMDNLSSKINKLNEYEITFKEQKTKHLTQLTHLNFVQEQTIISLTKDNSLKKAVLEAEINSLKKELYERDNLLHQKSLKEEQLMEEFGTKFQELLSIKSKMENNITTDNAFNMLGDLKENINNSQNYDSLYIKDLRKDHSEILKQEFKVLEKIDERLKNLAPANKVLEKQVIVKNIYQEAKPELKYDINQNIKQEITNSSDSMNQLKEISEQNNNSSKITPLTGEQKEIPSKILDGSFKELNQDKFEESSAKIHLHPDKSLLAPMIESALSHGDSKEKLLTSLMDSGYTKEEIMFALNLFKE